jgi:hypothetical protein
MTYSILMNKAPDGGTWYPIQALDKTHHSLNQRHRIRIRTLFGKTYDGYGHSPVRFGRVRLTTGEKGWVTHFVPGRSLHEIKPWYSR